MYGLALLTAASLITAKIASWSSWLRDEQAYRVKPNILGMLTTRRPTRLCDAPRKRQREFPSDQYKSDKNAVENGLHLARRHENPLSAVRARRLSHHRSDRRQHRT